MRFAIDIAPLGDLADPAAIVRLATAAEASGWDGVSLWDVTGVSMGTVAPDPFVALAGVAGATERLRLILSVVALPRRRPQLVTQAVGTLDRLSGGRVVLGVGAGGDPGDFAAFGEAAPVAERVARLDADLAVIDPWLRGEPARLDRPDAAEVVVGPAPVQRPRPPIWLGGMRPGALRRAARWDGWIAIAVAEDGSGMVLDPADFGRMAETVRAHQQELGRADAPFDVAVFGQTEVGDRATPAAFAERGATWWLESLSLMRDSVDSLMAVVEAGPPR
jgi:alkanesulfonate monooxygenase SsuD/methylene tetrahydromethanopterin reductase-like flavin-dependent oxidoreductase (luciferase family)